MSTFILFNASRRIVSVECGGLPETIRLGRSRGYIAHLHHESATTAVCGRIRVAAMREAGTERAGTSYLRMCPYCMAWAQRKERGR